MENDSDRIPERGTLGLSEQAWTEAQRRYPVIAPLAAQEAVTAAEARAAANQLALSSRTIYVLIALMGSLAPGKPSGGRGRARISARLTTLSRPQSMTPT